jgi:hypothetical protein
VIQYPDDEAILDQARRHGLPPDVLVRDLVRMVEVLNLRDRSFFNKRSVLAGSMALRSFGSPRFTVFDADFSTSRDTVDPETKMTELLAYEDDDLVITPAPVVPHSDGGGTWKSQPVQFTPVFTGLVPDPADREFKADVSFRGLIRDGREEELRVPYDLGIWDEPPTIFVMDPVETIAEKALGWCAYGLVKHYADLGYMAIVSQSGPHQVLTLDRDYLREAMADKLERMRSLHPQRYEPFTSLEDVISKLAQDPEFDRGEWEKLVYVREHRDTLDQNLLRRAVQEILVPLIS